MSAITDGEVVVLSFWRRRVKVVRFRWPVGRVAKTWTWYSSKRLRE
jgi:hypothetical protein